MPTQSNNHFRHARRPSDTSAVSDNHKLWNSLEIAKLASPIIASLILASVGFYISSKLEQLKATTESYSQRVNALTTKRITLYDSVGRRMDQIFCYYMYVGKWKQFSPIDIIRKKRAIDEIMYTYQPFFFGALFQYIPKFGAPVIRYLHTLGA